MSIIVDEYLNTIKSNLRIESERKKEILTEISAHIEDKIQDLLQCGLRYEEAVKISLSLLGSAKSLARQIYEAHSQGSWKQALMASLPHLLFGLLFILNWWRGLGAMLVMLIIIMAITVYGWWHDRSTWIFPWLGYLLLPVIAAGLVLLCLPRTLSWIAILIYLPLALWLILHIVKQTIKNDWLYISLMLLPIPVIICWFILAEYQGYLDENTLNRLSQFGPSIGISFLALGSGVISFVRIRYRELKILVLFMTGAIALGLILFYAWGRIEFVAFLLLVLSLISIFLIPALLENSVRLGRWSRIKEKAKKHHNPFFDY